VILLLRLLADTEDEEWEKGGIIGDVINGMGYGHPSLPCWLAPP
jgi:hypothetical protein